MENVATKGKFAIKLKELREQVGFSQTQLANELGISRGSISYYENDERQPDVDVLVRLCKYFNVSADYLIGLSDTQSLDTDMQAVCKYTGLSEAFIEYAHSLFMNSQKCEKESLSIENEMSNVIQTIENSTGKKKEEAEDQFVDLDNRKFELDNVVYDYEIFDGFISDLVSFSQLNKIVRAYAIACEEQSKDLKLIRYSEFLKNGSCKYEEELSEFVSAKENGLLVNDSENDNLNSALFTLSRLVLKMVETKAEKDSVTEEYLQNELAKADNLLKKEFEDSVRQTLSKPFKSIIDKAVDDAYEAYMNSTGKSSGQQEGENNAQHKSENE